MTGSPLGIEQAVQIGRKGAAGVLLLALLLARLKAFQGLDDHGRVFDEIRADRLANFVFLLRAEDTGGLIGKLVGRFGHDGAIALSGLRIDNCQCDEGSRQDGNKYGSA